MNEAIEAANTAIEREEYDEASRLLLPLAESGMAEAQYLLGCLYFNCCVGDAQGSRAWLEKAAAQEHPEALRWLAERRSDRFSGMPVDEKHRELLVRAAELGSIQAQRDLGCYFALGEEGWPLDPAQGRKWYERAAASGHADAQYNFGCMLLYGEGGPVDGREGMDWIRRAAAQGDIAAIRHLNEFPNPNPSE